MVRVMMKYVGELELGTKVDITDPCYDKGTWCRMTIDCEPGLYKGYVEITNEGNFGKEVASVSIFKGDTKCGIEEMERIGDIGVDAGLAGFFNDKPDFSDAEWDELCNKISEGDAWNLYNGIFSLSGYGDGCYNVYANKERNAFTIVFIEKVDIVSQLESPDGHDNLSNYGIMEKETQIEILMKDKCTRKEAERHLKNGSTVFEDFEENFESYMDEWGVEEEEQEKYKDMIKTGNPVADWGVVKKDGKTYYIMYVL